MTSVSGCSPSGLLSQSHDTIMQLEEITNYTNSKKPCDYTGRECGDSTGIFKEIIKISDAVQAFNFSETVLIGKILSVEILSKTISSPYPCETECSSNGFAFYEVQVEEYLKNPSDTKIIKVLGNYSINSGRGENPPFEVGQTVLLYIQKENRIPGYDVVIRTGDSRVLDDLFVRLVRHTIMDYVSHNQMKSKQISNAVTNLEHNVYLIPFQKQTLFQPS
jgi:hypothetical protein